MPYTSEPYGKSIPNNTYKGWVNDQGYPVNNDTTVLNNSETLGSSAGPRKVEANLDNLETKSSKESSNVTSTKQFWTTTKKIVLACIVVAICGGIGVGVYFIVKRTTSSTSDSIASTSGTTVATTAGNTTTTTATTTPSNPCGSSVLRWNTVGITVLNSTQLQYVNGLYMDSNNNLYIVDEYYNYVVWKLLNNASTATLVAGAVGSASSASNRLYNPQNVYFDRNGDLYVTDYYNYRVQKYINGSTTGTTIAGITSSGGSALTQFNGLRHFVFDSTDTYMFVTDFNNHRVMRYLTNSTSGTSGVLVAGGNGAGNGNNYLYCPWGIHYLPSVSSDLYITNYYGHTVIRWTPGASSGTIVTGVSGSSGQSPVLLYNPTGVKLDIYQNMYVADSNNHRIQMFCGSSQTGITVAGTGIAGNSLTQLNGPRTIIFDASMNMYVADTTNQWRSQDFLSTGPFPSGTLLGTGQPWAIQWSTGLWFRR